MCNTVLLVVFISFCSRMTDGIKMCENKTLTTNSTFIQKTGRNSPTNCWCTILSANGSPTQVVFNVLIYIGQQYKLSISKGSATSYFENSMSPDIFYAIRGLEEIKLKLEENDCSAKDSLEFGIDIKSLPVPIKITCHKPTVSTPELCQQTTSQVISTVTTKGPVTTTSPVKTEPPATASTGTYTASSSGEISSTEKASGGSTNTQNDKTTNSAATGDLVPGLIGGLVTCIIVVIVLVIVIVCIVRSKQQKEEFYSHPATVRPPLDDGYTDLNFIPSRQQPVV